MNKYNIRKYTKLFLLLMFSILAFIYVAPEYSESVKQYKQWDTALVKEDVVQPSRDLLVLIYQFAHYLLVLVGAIFMFLTYQVAKTFKGFHLLCPKCGNFFGQEMAIGAYGPNKWAAKAGFIIFKPRWFIKCPKCKKYSWCKMIETD
jgi:hypothetical protein